ncbi:MAG: hypothetical protein MJZ14_06785 [Paludibacteraceae bacterium]|nr:hypothetical protein [Paludibacteraceae bacterium]
MKKYLLLLVLGLCAISGLAVAFLGGEKQQPVAEPLSWNYVDMRSVCYMSVECVTTDFSPVQESIYANRLMYGELPMSFLLTVETNQPINEIEAIGCLVECAGVKLEADLKDIVVEKRDGKTVCSGIFVKDLSPVAKELGEPAVMDMMKIFPKDVKISIKHQSPAEVASDYVVVKQ